MIPLVIRKGFMVLKLTEHSPLNRTDISFLLVLQHQNAQCHWETVGIPDSRNESPFWEASSRLCSQEIASFLWFPKVHSRVHESPPLVPILSKMNLVHILTPCIFKIYFNIILPSMPGLSKDVLPPNSSTNTVYVLLFSPMRATHSTHSILLCLVTLIMFREE